MNQQFESAKMSSAELLEMANKKNGDGVNVSIPMTLRQFPALTKRQKIRDSQIVKELVYLCDVRNEKDRAFTLFFENKHRLSDPCYWEILRTMWIANGKRETLIAFRQMFQSKRPFKRFLMTIEEEKVFSELPDPITAWRAKTKVGDVGISWTLNREVAERFAKAYERVIIERQLPKSRITAYFNRRNEQEIIVL